MSESIILEETKFAIIELALHIQRSIEILDDLDVKNNPLKNKKLNQAFKGIYPMLEKETKTYNELFQCSEEDTMYFYDVIHENARTILRKSLLDKALIESFLFCHEKDPNSMGGIMNKIIKNNKQ